jgi:hypothetical protein
MSPPRSRARGRSSVPACRVCRTDASSSTAAWVRCTGEASRAERARHGSACGPARVHASRVRTLCRTVPSTRSISSTQGPPGSACAVRYLETMNALRPCPTCHRHAREASCPFCGAVIGPEREMVPVARYLSRAAFLTALASAAAACAGGTGTVGGGSSSSGSGSSSGDPCDNGGCAPAYGISPIDPPDSGGDDGAARRDGGDGG